MHTVFGLVEDDRGFGFEDFIGDLHTFNAKRFVNLFPTLVSVL